MKPQRYSTKTLTEAARKNKISHLRKQRKIALILKKNYLISRYDELLAFYRQPLNAIKQSKDLTEDQEVERRVIFRSSSPSPEKSTSFRRDSGNRSSSEKGSRRRGEEEKSTSLRRDSGNRSSSERGSRKRRKRRDSSSNTRSSSDEGSIDRRLLGKSFPSEESSSKKNLKRSKGESADLDPEPDEDLPQRVREVFAFANKYMKREKKAKKLESELKELESALRDAAEQLVERRRLLEDANSELEELKSRTNTLEEENENCSKKLEAKMNENALLVKQYDKFVNERKEILDDLADLKLQLADKNSELQDEKDSHKETREQVKNVNRQNRKLTTRAEDAEHQLETYKNSKALDPVELKKPRKFNENWGEEDKNYHLMLEIKKESHELKEENKSLKEKLKEQSKKINEDRKFDQTRKNLKPHYNLENKQVGIQAKGKQNENISAQELSKNNKEKHPKQNKGLNTKTGQQHKSAKSEKRHEKGEKTIPHGHKATSSRNKQHSSNNLDDLEVLKEKEKNLKKALKDLSRESGSETKDIEVLEEQADAFSDTITLDDDEDLLEEVERIFFKDDLPALNDMETEAYLKNI